MTDEKAGRLEDAPAVASPAAAGPSGALLEGHVGAQYLLPLLSGGEARGLPGVVVARVSFQRASFNHPMDDVIVTGHDRQGRPATLELQAKRTIAFTPGDRIFAEVVALACRAATRPEFVSTRYELAVAVARTSTKIEQHIQDVLKWAREYDAASFFRRLNQAGAAHQGMRDFVAAFRGHMYMAGAAHDDANVWQLLSRFLVLAFDFEQPGSVCAQLARERCALQLAPQDIGRAGELWDSLQQIALQVDAAGGDLNALALRDRLVGERGYLLAGDRRLHVVRERLSETAENTLATINSCVHGVTIDRGSRVAVALTSLEQGRYLEIRGVGGVGKSGVLKDLALRLGVESRIIVVAPHRVPGGGWAAQAAQLGCEVSARELLTDLAGDGGGTLFIDGIDRFDDPSQRATVADLIRAAAQVQGFSVVVTARLDFDTDSRAWLPSQALLDLGEAPPLVIDELDDDEVAQLRDADPALAALLRVGHPAEKLVRNLYRLDRLARGAAVEAIAPFSEAQMAWQWWSTGDSADVVGRLERRRLLRSLAVHSLTSSAPMDASTSSAEAVNALVESGSLRALNSVRVEPAHDVLRDWAIGCLLYEEPEHFAAFALKTAAPLRLVRGVELAARLHAEGNGAEEWKVLLDRMSEPGLHGSWRRAVLLALARSERANDALSYCLPVLAAGNAELLADLVRAVITVDSQSAVPLWEVLGADTSKFTDDVVMPRGPAWMNLIFWSLSIQERLPHAVVPQFVDLYSRWCTAHAGVDTLSPLLVARLYAWLVEIEAKRYPKASGSKEWIETEEAPGLSMATAQESDLRTAFLLWCKLRPGDAESYLRGMATHPRRYMLFRQLLSFVGSAPYAAPGAMVDLFLQALPEGDDKEEGGLSSRRDMFSTWGLEFFPASPARAPFLALLLANKEQGLRLVRGVVGHAIQCRSRGREPGSNHIEISLPNGRRSFPWRQSYFWSRSPDSSVVASALMALEAWAHLCIERGEPAQIVLDDVLGPEGSPAAYLLVAVDVMLSHWPKTRECLWPFAASAELLALDRQRFAREVQANRIATVWVRPEPSGVAQLGSLQQRPSRRLALDSVLYEYGWEGPADVREAMQQSLRAEVAQIGPPDIESNGMADPSFAAMCALNRLDYGNYVLDGIGEDGQPIISYVLPAEEARLTAEIQEKAQSGLTEIAIRLQLMRALTESRCSEQLLEQGIDWAKRDSVPDDPDKEWSEKTRFIVAALVLRDGSLELKAEQGDWALDQLAEAETLEADDRGFPKQLPYNPAAIAAVGLLAAYRDDHGHTSLQRLLQLAVRRDTGMASVLRVEVAEQRPLSQQLFQSLVRLGLVSAIYAVPQRSTGFGSGADYLARMQALEMERNQAEKLRLKSAVTAELHWLAGEGSEPGWPELPSPPPPKARHGISLVKPRHRGKKQPLSARNFALDAAAAAQWLSFASELWYVAHPDLLCGLVRHCWPWTAGANGVASGPNEEPGERAFEWNTAYFAASLSAAVSVGEAGIKQYVLDPLSQLPEERFLDATTAVLHALDQLWLGRGSVSDSTAVSIREALVRSFVATESWRRLATGRSTGVELHAAGAIAAIFMGQHVMGQGPRCDVLPPGAARADLLLPMLTQLAEQAAGATFVALAFLGLLEVQPHVSRLGHIARAVAAWWRIQGASTEFWIDYGIGRRLCDWIDKAVLGAPVSVMELGGTELTAVVDILVQCGTPLARALEERLGARRDISL